MIVKVLLLSDELLAEHCLTDDLLPSIPISYFPPCRMHSKVLRLQSLVVTSSVMGQFKETPQLESILVSSLFYGRAYHDVINKQSLLPMPV